MAWQTPKTDWQVSTGSNGKYTGDFFTAKDFNRIKNNLAYLRDLAVTYYDNFSIEDLGDDRTVKAIFYAEEINRLEENLKTINSNTYNRDYGEAPEYRRHGPTMDYIELNRLESATLDLYERLTNTLNYRRMLTWNFGMGVDF